MKHPFLALSFIIIVLFGCNDNDDDKKTLHLNIVGAAYENSLPSPSFKATWTDATLNPLGVVGNHYGGFADGEDAYYCGFDNGSPAYWKNGELVTLNGVGFVWTMFVLNGDVYCAGFIETEISRYTPVYWKNKEMTLITTKSGELPTFLLSMFVSGNDVYVVGGYTDNSGSCWKNGQEMTISADNLFITDIAILNNDVHVIASSNTGEGALYFKNGVKTTLPPTSDGKAAWPRSIFVDGSDVYITGQQYGSGETTAAYWKNGAPVLLPGGTDAIRIKKSGDDIYVVGYQIKSAGTGPIPIYWKNAVAVEMQLVTTPVISQYKLYDFDFVTK